MKKKKKITLHASQVIALDREIQWVEKYEDYSFTRNANQTPDHHKSDNDHRHWDE